ncbi:MAG TPA: hypothetical protein VEV17_07975 [Bryobacteraceae bacterium]|nr:hypothetical protein [Bryobacteraceae bacterium]
MRTFAALTVILTPFALLAGTNQWTNIGPDAGNVFALVVDPQDSRTLFASTDGGLFKTSDAGASWSAVSSPKGLDGWSMSLAIDPQTSGTLYAGLSGDRVYKSTDGGASWSAPSGDMEDYLSSLALPGSLAIDPQNPATLYAAMHHGVYKSTDGGGSWSAATAGLPLELDAVRMLAVDPKSSGTVYAACRGDIGANSGVYAGSGVYKSTDGGITWRALNSGLPAQNLEVWSLAVDPQDPDAIYAATNSGMFKSTDGGEGWSAANSGLPPLGGFASLAIDPQNTATVYAAFRFPPSGQPLTANPVASLGVFKSTDGGASWVSAALQDSISVIAIDPQNSSTLYAGSARGLGIRKSTDGAATWTRSSVGLRGLNIWAFAVDPQDTSKVYAATGSGIFKTTNSGASWSEANSGLSAGEFGGSMHPGSLAIDPQNPDTLYVGIFGGGIFKTTDGGASWSYSGLGGNGNFDQSLVVDPRNPGTLYAAGFSSGTSPTAIEESSHVFKSTDGGATWEPKGSFPTLISLVTMDPQDSSTLYAANSWDGRTIFKSQDGGETWSPLATPPGFAMLAEEAPDILVLQVDPQDPQTIYAGGGLSGLIKTTDGGDSWEAVNFGMPSAFVDRSSSVTALAIDPHSNTVYAAAGGLMLQSPDGAVTWTEMNALPPRSGVGILTIDPRDPNTLYAGTGSGVFAITFVP